MVEVNKPMCQIIFFEMLFIIHNKMHKQIFGKGCAMGLIGIKYSMFSYRFYYSEQKYGLVFIYNFYSI